MPLSQPETQDEIKNLRARLHEMSNQLMIQGRTPAKQTASNTAVIAMVGSGIGILIGVITVGTLVFNIGGSVREMQVIQNGFTAAVARLEGSVNSGRDQRERDVGRLETMIKRLDDEQRAQANRLTRTEVLQGVQRPTPQADDGTTVAGGEGLPLPLPINALRRELLGDI